MAPDPRLIELFSYYREGEMHGAGLLLRLIKMMEDDGDAQIKLTLHMAEEANHAWLWTKRIADLGGTPVQVSTGYQTRIGRRTIPRGVIDLLALTIIVEERSVARYKEHASRKDVDPETKEVLDKVTGDEVWHMSWIRGKLDEIAAAQNKTDYAAEMVEKYREVDREVYGELRAMEIAAYGGTPP